MNRFNLSAIAVRERAVTLFFLLLLVAAGAYAFLMLGRAEDPSFTIKTLTVTTAWPGATAREMQDLVAEPLEKRLQELTWYDRVETDTRPGYAYMTVTLKDSTPPSVVQEEFYQARKKLGDEARNLPPGIKRVIDTGQRYPTSTGADHQGHSHCEDSCNVVIGTLLVSWLSTIR